jgi:hypothetical protein
LSHFPLLNVTMLFLTLLPVAQRARSRNVDGVFRLLVTSSSVEA